MKMHLMLLNLLHYFHLFHKQKEGTIHKWIFDVQRPPKRVWFKTSVLGLVSDTGNTKDIRWRGRRRWRGRDSLNALEAGDAVRPNHLWPNQRCSFPVYLQNRHETVILQMLFHTFGSFYFVVSTFHRQFMVQRFGFNWSLLFYTGRTIFDLFRSGNAGHR